MIRLIHCHQRVNLAKVSHFAGFYLAVAFLLIGCTSTAPSSEISGETDDVQFLEGNAEIVIPDGVSDLHGFVSGLQDVTTYVRFTTRVSSVDTFISSTLCDTSPVLINVPLASSNLYLPNWWDLHQADNLKSCIGNSDHLHQEVYLSSSDAGEVKVYVIAYTK